MFLSRSLLLATSSVALTHAWFGPTNTEKCRNDQQVFVNTLEGWKPLPLKNIMYSFQAQVNNAKKIEWSCDESPETHKTKFNPNSKVNVYVKYDGIDVEFIVADYKVENAASWIEDLKRGQRPVNCCQGANFENQDLSGLDLSLIDFRGANLKKANLTGATLKGADLMKANLTETIFTPEIVEGGNNMIRKLVTGDVTQEELDTFRSMLEKSKLETKELEAMIDLAELRLLDYESFESQLQTISNNTEERLLNNPSAQAIADIVGGSFKLADTVINGTLGENATTLSTIALFAGTHMAVVGAPFLAPIVAAGAVALAGVTVHSYIWGTIFSNFGNNDIDRCRQDNLQIQVDGVWKEVKE
eukprot:Pgem_evm1s6992